MKILRASTRLACLLTICLPAGADTLTLGAALERADKANPLLAAHVADSESVAARAALESLAPPLTLATELENFAGNGEMRGLDSAEATVQVTRQIELGGKRAGRRALGDAEIARSRHSLAGARLDVRSLTTRRFLVVVADQQRLSLATERVELASRTREEVARVVAHARNPETDLRAAEISLADAELERERAGHELRAARVSLASTWGARQPDFEQASMALDAIQELEPLEAIASRLPASALMRETTLDTEVAAARLRLAQSQSRPDLTVGLGVRRLEAFGDNGLVMSMSLPLGTGSRARLAQAESRAQATAVDRRRESLEAESYQRLFEIHQELDQTRAQFTALTGTMIPKAEQAMTLANRGFELGRFPFTSLAQAQQTLFDLRRRRIDAALRYHVLSAEMQRLVAAAEAP